MVLEEYKVEQYGFAGFLAVPDAGSDMDAEKAVLVLKGCEKGPLTGSMIARRFAQLGFTALSVTLYGAPGLAPSPEKIQIEPVLRAVHYLKKQRKVRTIAAYGLGKGSVFAVYAALLSGDLDTVILVSPTHVLYEGHVQRRSSSGHSIMTLDGEELPFLPVNRTSREWKAFRDAYRQKGDVQRAALPIERLRTSILMIASECDDRWPAAHSVRYLQRRLTDYGYPLPLKTCIYPGAGHLLGILPDLRSNPMMLPLFCTQSEELLHHRRSSEIREVSEKEVIDWIRNEWI